MSGYICDIHGAAGHTTDRCPDLYAKDEEHELAMKILRTLRQWHADNALSPDPFYPTDETMYEGSGADHAEFLYILLEEAMK